MNLLPYVIIGLGGALGAITRYGIIQFSESNIHKDSSVGVMLANVIGCILLGAILASFDKYAQIQFKLFVTVGFLGGMTTFSTYILDIYKIWTDKGPLHSVVYTVASILLSMAGYIVAYKTVSRLIA